MVFRVRMGRRIGALVLMFLVSVCVAGAAPLDPAVLRPACSAGETAATSADLAELTAALDRTIDPAVRCSAIFALEQLAAAGDGEAALIAGKAFADGVVVQRDIARAKANYESGFRAGSAEAAMRLGEITLAQSDPASLAAAAAYFEDARSLGATEAGLGLGDYFVSVGDGESARSSYSEAAEQGVAEAYLRLGDLLASGELVRRDLAGAKSAYRSAIERGHPEGAAALAAMQFEEGDIGGGTATLRSAVEAGNAAAAVALGDLYRNGDRLPVDLARAEEHYRQAATLGDPKALLRLGDMQRAATPELAARSYAEALEAGVAAAGVELGELFLEHPDLAPAGAAMDSFSEAFLLGSNDAAAPIARLLLQSDEPADRQLAAAYLFIAPADAVPVERAEAAADAMLSHPEAAEHAALIVALYEAAQRGGSASAANKVGDLHFDGRLVPRDLGMAERSYEAGGFNVPPATMLVLGDARRDGAGIELDPALAAAHYRRALEGGVAEAGLRLGDLLRAGNDAPAAAAAYVRAAELGAIRAFLLAADVLQSSDAKAASGLYERALAAGEAEAAARLGDLNFDGPLGNPDLAAAAGFYEVSPQGYPDRALMPLAAFFLAEADHRDPARSAKLYQAALDRGVTKAGTELGLLYLSNTLGAPQPTRAEAYFNASGTTPPAPALIALGNAYRDGNEVAPDGRRAAEYYEAALAAGASEANRLLGDLYFEGTHLPADPARAIRHYEAYGAIPEEALLIGGDLYRDGKMGSPDGQKSLSLYEAAVKAGLPGASLRLGDLLATGALVTKDLDRAIELFESSPEGVPTRFLMPAADHLLASGLTDRAVGYFELALAQGATEAATRLGTLYFEGNALPRDLGRAEHYFRLAPEGVPVATALTFGDAYREGTGVAADPARAVAFYQQALEADRPVAARRLADLMLSGTQVPRDLVAAAMYYDQTTNVPASVLLTLGLAFLDGDSVPADPARAVGYLERAANSGEVAALVRLGETYSAGDLVPADAPRAERYLEEAARKGDPVPLLALANRYLAADVPSDETTRGVALLRTAIGIDVPEAAPALADALLAGTAVPRDVPGAVEVLEAALADANTEAGLRLLVIYRDGMEELPAQPDEARRVLDQISAALPPHQAAAEDILLTASRRAGLPSDIAAFTDRFATLDNGSKADLLAALRPRNDNAYVYLLQSELAARGQFGAEPNGQLTGPTIRAMLALCETSGAMDVCSAGPMSEASTQVITDALR